MKIAVIGAGPAGFFVAEELLKKLPGCEVHMIERRIAPYGLVRYGVAPDHQLTRRVAKMFDRIAEQAGFRFHGNVDIGRDVSLEALRDAHHAVVVCTGAEVPNRPDIPGAKLTGAVDALDLCRWVNGETDAFAPERLNDVETAVVIGNGNVALDSARILARPSADWVATDMSPHAMEALAHHRVRRIVIVGRRGSEDASFTEAELEEVVSLPGWDVEVEGKLPFGLQPNGISSDKKLAFRFQLNPVGLLGNDRVTGARFAHAVTGDTVDIPSQLVVFATGHRGVPLNGLPFDDERGVIPNDRGRVAGCSGFYVCGWIKRGAKGLIGQNRKDAIETTARIIEDRDELSAHDVSDIKIGEDGRSVSWSEWRALDAVEMQKGAAVGRPRIGLSRAEALSELGRPADGAR